MASTAIPTSKYDDVPRVARGGGLRLQGLDFHKTFRKGYTVGEPPLGGRLFKHTLVRIIPSPISFNR